MDEVDMTLDPTQFVSPGILWWAFAWQDAHEQKSVHPYFLPEEDDPGDESAGVVLLLDEIDKADSDLPNSLLETLDNGRFTVPWLKKTIGAGRTDSSRPLVIITTNEDRQLPGAFVRRCLVLELWVPDKEEALYRYLKERATFHFPKENGGSCGTKICRNDDGSLIAECKFTEKVLKEAVSQLAKDRRNAGSQGVTQPGQAEFLDMLCILDELAPGDAKKQLELLKTIKNFTLKKYPRMQLEEEKNQSHRKL